MKRRDFLKTGAGTIAIGTAGTCVCGGCSCSTLNKMGDATPAETGSYTFENHTLKLDLTKNQGLKSTGGSIKIIDTSLPEPLIIAHTAKDKFSVCSIKCTHRGVEVEYHHEKQYFRCASLGSSKFALDGKKLAGLAKGPLTSYPTTIKDNTLEINMMPAKKSAI